MELNSREGVEICAICRDRVDVSENNIVKPHCGHLFHFNCCMSNLNYSNTSP